MVKYNIYEALKMPYKWLKEFINEKSENGNFE